MPSANSIDDILNPSSYRLPEDFDENSDEYEIWSLRAPVKFDMATLNGVSLQFNLQHERKGNEPHVTSFQVQGETWSLAQGHTTEVSSFRILKANDDEEQKGMTPLPISFDRHFNLTQSTKSNIADIDLAPSNERAPKVELGETRMRIPYTPIDQKSGLKRRWNMLGSNANYAPVSCSEGSQEALEHNTPKKMKKKKQKKSKKSSQ